LLYSKDEYNRYLVPTISVEGQSHPRQQAEMEQALDLNITRLTKEQEEEALSQAKFRHVKKRYLGKQLRDEETKRIRLDRQQGIKGGGGEAGVEGGDRGEEGDSSYSIRQGQGAIQGI
jgi:hypothetical protein